MSLEALIKQRIRDRGPIGVAEYMALALSHPEYGYYMRGDPFGVQGDFITAPEISQVFGELIGAWLASQWIAMERPKAALVELGPGRGTLMSDILRATRHITGFHDSISVHLIETSPTLKQMQWNALAGKHPNLQWHAEFAEIPKEPLLLVANEFFDALPIRQYIYSEGEWHERGIGVTDDHLEFVILSECNESKGLLKGSLDFARDDMIIETCETAKQIAATIGRHITRHGGCGLIIDYGYTEGSRGDTLQAVKQHQYHDVLAEPGCADLTAHVDFAALTGAATEAGAAAYGPVSQGFFLAALGISARTARLCHGATPPQKTAMLSAMERLTSPDQMGDLFKVMCMTQKEHPRPEGF